MKLSEAMKKGSALVRGQLYDQWINSDGTEACSVTMALIGKLGVAEVLRIRLWGACEGCYLSSTAREHFPALSELSPQGFKGARRWDGDDLMGELVSMNDVQHMTAEQIAAELDKVGL